MTGTGRRRRGGIGRVAVAVVVVVVAAGAAATAATAGFGFGVGRHGGDRNSGTGGLSPATAQVTRQTLVDSQTKDGSLGYGATESASAKLGGTITALAATGATVKRGQALYRVDNTPVVLLYGSLPAYRSLQTGVEGTDVKQFEQNLKALGYSGFTVDDEYGASTAATVKQWQEDLGLPETGTVELGRIVYAAGPVRVDSQKAAVGDAVQPGTAVLTYTGTARVITVELDVDEQRLAKKGATVTVTLPNGKTVAGKIAKTQTVIDTGGSGNGGNGSNEPETKIEAIVTVNDAKALNGLDQAAVDVGFTASQRENVLTVPVAALLALAEGGYGVQVVEGTTTRIVSVQTGLFANGRVEVSGDGLAEGMTVGAPS
ncbi:efflux RND transporter periplasmic adaptor subunit [Micromonospora sp. DR5-3]|uniref:efflux RND transporter periplasmic adaptor subunit n=1 Tax=unclassified Micromonospora TaxID=2617518 RepID=UPI00210395BA|nr:MULTISPECIES: peptidoglycan-binding protein [unclassified Micromonospora]MCW3819389.1 efflux RND transporter periplasmic adaptor subunit [Micromonospora sp. DR5-3]